MTIFVMSDSRVYDPRTVGEDSVVRSVVEELDAFHMASIYPMEKDENESKYALPNFHASMFATILEDAITQIRILAQCNNELSVSKLYSDMPLLLAVKFGVKQIPVDELDCTDKDSDKKKMDKLNNDRKLFVQVCLDAYKDLTMNSSYEALARHVTALIDLDKYRVNMVEEEAKNRQWHKELRKQLRQLRNHITSVTYEMDANIENLRAETEDCEVVDGVVTRYVDGWQRARSEQHIQNIYKDQLKTLTTIDFYKEREEHDQRVHAEIEMFTNITINDTLQQIEDWMEKYDTDAEVIELKIRIRKNDWMDILRRRKDLEAMILKHEEMISEWNSFKEERARINAYRNLMNKSAIMVQAWWRGMLVRRCLGPYKIKEPKKKSKT